jgi:uncharacterized protein (TIGR02246 family)
MISVHIRRLLLTALMFVAVGCTQSANGDDSPQAAAVRKSLAGLAQAFNKHDAAGVAAAWAENAVYVDLASGIELAGREKIQAHYAQLFQQQPQIKLTAKISKIEVEDDTRAFVRGNAEVTVGDGEPTVTSFLAELVQEKGRWLLLSVEEDDPDPLADLDWLVGDWKDEGDGRSVRSTFAWDPGGRFLVRKYSIADESGAERTGTQYIVWDPASGEIRSWVFGSEGGFGEATWTPRDDHWAIHWTATLVDGRQASATQVLKPIDQDSFQVQWTDIDIDGELRPSTEPVTVRRVASEAANTGGANHE